MTSLFAPNYGAASQHIKALEEERRDFLAASKAQASRIASLEDELHTLREKSAVGELISEHRAREVDRLNEALSAKDATIGRLRAALKLLWGVQTQVQTKAKDIATLVAEGTGLLETLDTLLKEEESSTISGE